MSKQGFTLIEIILVIALITVIAVSSLVFITPAFDQFSCRQEVDTIVLALERARHVSQFRNLGNIRLSITDSAYEVSVNGSNNETTLVDSFPRRGSIAVESDAAVVFERGSGGTLGPARISVGGENSPCQEFIFVNDVGAIL